MTEDEAKTKWCPFVNHYNAVFQACGNSIAGSSHDRSKDMVFHCIASACMAWRKEYTAAPTWEVTWRGKTEVYNWDPSGNSDYADAVIKQIPRDTHGYCGLAGKP